MAPSQRSRIPAAINIFKITTGGYSNAGEDSPDSSFFIRLLVVKWRTRRIPNTFRNLYTSSSSDLGWETSTTQRK
jgi:hypothetical protein